MRTGHAVKNTTKARRLAAWLATATILGAGMVGAATGLPSAVQPEQDVGLAHAAARTAAPTLTVGRDAWVAVSVATLWRSPDAPRDVDGPALARPALVEKWLSSMSVAQRRGLNGRADTQALFGDRVRVVRLRPGWAKVVVPSQPSPLDARGYPGWVPSRQLTTATPTRTPRVATVVRRTTWLRTDRAEGRNLFRTSFGTRLSVRSADEQVVRVLTPSGTVRRVARSAVVVHDRQDPAVVATRRSLVRNARKFLGLPYLWAGRSGFGVDCSGFTSLVYRVHGVRIPRDAPPQSQGGTAVAAPRAGDLMFYARGGAVHHVSMYVGDGRMIHAPGTGADVQVTPTSTPAYRSEYVGARRYLP